MRMFVLIVSGLLVAMGGTARAHIAEGTVTMTAGEEVPPPTGAPANAGGTDGVGDESVRGVRESGVEVLGRLPHCLPECRARSRPDARTAVLSTSTWYDVRPCVVQIEGLTRPSGDQYASLSTRYSVLPTRSGRHLMSNT